MERQYHHLLSEEDDASSESSDSVILEKQPSHISTFRQQALLIVSCLLLSLLLNALSLAYYISHEYGSRSLEVGKHSYSGLKYDTPMMYNSSTDYWNDFQNNDTRSDVFWEAIDADPIGVALDDEYVAKHGLPDSISFPWDTSKRVYTIKAIHHMHCLKNLHRAFRDEDLSLPPQIPRDHVYHCLDILRQDILCLSDDTLMHVIPMTNGHDQRVIHNGDGEILQCRSYDKLLAWARAPEQSACYSQLSDYKETVHGLEHFAVCPPDSPYKPFVDKYFEIHGHVDPFVE